MTSMITLKTVATYTITSDGDCYYVNGNFVAPTYPGAGSNFVLLLDTGCKGANGKRDYVGLTTDHVAAHNAHKAALDTARAALPQNIYNRLIDDAATARAIKAEAAEADVYAAMRGRVPAKKDYDAAIASADAALAAFEAAHPHLVQQRAAKIEAERQARIASAYNH